MLKDRDKAILQKIGDYCQQIEQTVARFGADFETYCADHVYRNACCMCILQIGELVGKLSGGTDRRPSQYPVAQHSGDA